MVQKEEEIIFKKRLSQKYVSEYTLEHLLKIGLVRRTDECLKINESKRYYLLIRIMMLIMFVKSVLVLFVSNSDENKYIFLILGDFHYYSAPIQNHFNLMLAIMALVGLSAYPLNLSSSSNTLKPFLMMSGLLTPFEVGLNNKKDIKLLLRRNKYIFFLIDLATTYALPFAAALYGFGIIFLNYSLFDLILLGIPSGIFFTFNITTIVSNIFLMISYFHLICYYNKLKMNFSNRFLRYHIGNNRRRNKMNVRKMLLMFDHNYVEISQENQVWCKYSLVIYFGIVSIILIILYQAIFGYMHVILRICFFYGVCIFITTCLIFNLSAAMIYETTRETFKLLNQLYCKSLFTRNNLVEKMKVNKFYYRSNYLLVENKSFFNLEYLSRFHCSSKVLVLAMLASIVGIYSFSLTMATSLYVIAFNYRLIHFRLIHSFSTLIFLTDDHNDCT